MVKQHFSCVTRINLYAGTRLVCSYLYALRDAVEAQLNKMEADGVITPVNFSEWAAPTVNIPKVDHTVRICRDYKVSINP